MYWGQLHPRISVGGKSIDLPLCIGDPARQIRIEEVNRDFENVNRQIITDFVGFRITFILNWDYLESEDMANIIRIINSREAITLYPWSDVAEGYEVFSLDPQLDMNYFQDRAIIQLQTKELISTLYKP